MKIVIVGAGPAGLLLAHYLLQRPNYDIHLLEQRSDPRRQPPDSLRSFPISLQTKRGLRAIESIPGLMAEIQAVGTWTDGIVLHGPNEAKRRNNQYIPRRPAFLSVDRNNIVLAFLNHLQHVKPAHNSQVTLHFDSAVQQVDLKKRTLQVHPARTVAFDHLVAADGARSVIRQQLSDQGLLTFEQQDVLDDYKSIYLSLSSEKDVSFQLQRNNLHGWRIDGNKQVIVAVVHADFACGALIFARGNDPFVNMTSPDQVLDYLNESSPHSLRLLVTRQEAESLLKRPTTTLTSVRVDKMHINDTVLLLGDAVHAVSASLGQGCNSALQDAQLFVQALDKSMGSWSVAMPAFATRRLPHVQALVELSYYGSPRSKRLQTERMVRTILRSILPKFMTRTLMRPLPFDLLGSDEILDYTTILDKSQWWIDRVKKEAKRTDEKKWKENEAAM